MSKIINYNKEQVISRNSVKENWEVEPAEVIDIILSSTHELYKTPADIGKIKFRRIYSDFKKNNNQLSYAHSLNSYLNVYPLKHEIVMIFKSLTPTAGYIDLNTGFYYDMVSNIWNYTNNNALPFSTQNYNDENSKSTSEFTGVNNEQQSNEISLGEYFKENIKIPSLLPFEGDVIINGRYGNSIRFASTNLDNINNWSSNSSSSTIGNPLIIIRNDKNENSERFIVEDINENQSSIYITSTQLINLLWGNTKQDTLIGGYKLAAQNEFDKSQIILNSDRININSKTDSIILTSKESIWLSGNSVNIDSNEYTMLDSEKLYFGKLSNNEKEPVVLGQTLLDTLVEIIDNLITATYTTPVGPSGTMLPPSLTKLISLKTKLKAEKHILSKKCYLE